MQDQTLALGNDATLVMQTDGDLVLYSAYGAAAQRILWSAGAQHSCTSPCQASLQSDGNLVLSSGSTPYWDTNTAAGFPLQLVMSPVSPYLEILDGNAVLWSAAAPSFSVDSFSLAEGQLFSFGVDLTLTLQPDGTLALYREYGTSQQVSLWSVGGQHACTGDCLAVFRDDGSFVIDDGTTEEWSSGTSGHAPAQLVLSSSSPYLQIVGSAGAIWSSNPFLEVTAANRLILGARPFQAPSVNIPDLLELYVEGRPADGLAKMSDAARAGFTTFRFFAAGSYGESTVAFPALQAWQSSPATFFAAVDQMFADARRLGVYLVPSLATGVVNLADPADLALMKGPGFTPYCEDAFSLSFLPGSHNRQEMLSFIAEWAARYSGEDHLLFWEVGNELNLGVRERSARECATRADIHDYIADVSGGLKAADAHHLVASGTVQEDDYYPLDTPLPGTSGPFSYLGGFFSYYTDIPTVDLSTVHLYDGTTFCDGGNPASTTPCASVPAFTPAQVLQYFGQVAASLHKPLWIGEYGVAPGQAWPTANLNDFVAPLLLARSSASVDLATAWAWETAEYASPSATNGEVGPHPEEAQFSLDPSMKAVLSVLNQ